MHEPATSLNLEIAQKWTKDQDVRMHWVYSFPGRDTVETAGMAHGQIIL